MSGSAIRKAMVDLRRVKRARPPRRVVGAACPAAGMTAAKAWPSGTHVAFELPRGPVDRLRDRHAALRALGDQLGLDALHVHLVGDVGRGRRAGYRQRLVVLGRVMEHRTLRRLHLLPDLEVALAGEG